MPHAELCQRGLVVAEQMSQSIESLTQSRSTLSRTHRPRPAERSRPAEPRRRRRSAARGKPQPPSERRQQGRPGSPVGRGDGDRAKERRSDDEEKRRQNRPRPAERSRPAEPRRRRRSAARGKPQPPSERRQQGRPGSPVGKGDGDRAKERRGDDKEKRRQIPTLRCRLVAREFRSAAIGVPGLSQHRFFSS